MIPALIPTFAFGRLRGGGSPPANRFTLSVTPASRTIAPGESDTFEIELATEAGSVETADLTVHGLPAGATGEFSETGADTDGNDGPMTLTITVAGGAPAVAADSFQVRATAPSQTRSRTAMLTIPAFASNPTADNAITTADTDLLTADAA